MLARSVTALIVLAVPVSAKSANLRAIQHHTGSSCECLQWKDAYADYGVPCGLYGSELQPIMSMSGLSAKELVSMVGDEFCGKLFQRIPDNFCMNNDWVYNPSQWCYVSAACAEATPLPSMQASVKTCGQGDKMLMDFSFDQLYELTKTENENLVFGMLAQFAWKLWEADKWPAVESEIMSEKGPVRSDLKEMVASNQPVWIQSENGHPPFHLVKGNTVYEITFGSDSDAYEAGRMGNVNELVCLKGCA